ncbi:YybS family protein [Cytobacillus suaedae]|nr:YybS family protein [Cytobacillus suaedae]
MKKTKQLTEGAILIALYIIILLLFLYIPLIGILVLFLLPLPFIIYTIRNGLKNSIIFFIAALVVSFIIGTLMALPMTFMFGSSGIVLGYLIEKQKGRYALLLGGTVAFLLNIALLYIITVSLLNINLMEETITMTRETLETSNELLTLVGQESNEQALKQFEDAMKIFPYLLPSTFLMIAFIFSFFTQLFSIPFLKRLKVTIESWPPFRELRLPRSLLWYYLIVMLLMFIEFEVGTFGYTAVINLFYILQLLMMVQGFSFVFYYCFQKGISKAVPILILVFSLFIPILLYIIRILGIIDLGFQMRDKIAPKK